MTSQHRVAAPLDSVGWAVCLTTRRPKQQHLKPTHQVHRKSQHHSLPFLSPAPQNLRVPLDSARHLLSHLKSKQKRLKSKQQAVRNLRAHSALSVQLPSRLSALRSNHHQRLAHLRSLNRLLAFHHLKLRRKLLHLLVLIHRWNRGQRRPLQLLRLQKQRSALAIPSPTSQQLRRHQYRHLAQKVIRMKHPQRRVLRRSASLQSRKQTQQPQRQGHHRTARLHPNRRLSALLAPEVVHLDPQIPSPLAQPPSRSRMQNWVIRNQPPVRGLRAQWHRTASQLQHSALRPNHSSHKHPPRNQHLPLVKSPQRRQSLPHPLPLLLLQSLNRRQRQTSHLSISAGLHPMIQLHNNKRLLVSSHRSRILASAATVAAVSLGLLSSSRPRHQVGAHRSLGSLSVSPICQRLLTNRRSLLQRFKRLPDRHQLLVGSVLVRVLAVALLDSALHRKLKVPPRKYLLRQSNRSRSVVRPSHQALQLHSRQEKPRSLPLPAQTCRQLWYPRRQLIQTLTLVKEFRPRLQPSTALPGTKRLTR